MCQICFMATMARLEAGEVLDFSHSTGGMAPSARTSEPAAGPPKDSEGAPTRPAESVAQRANAEAVG